MLRPAAAAVLFFIFFAAAEKRCFAEPDAPKHEKTVQALKDAYAANPASDDLRRALSSALSQWGTALYESGRKKEAAVKLKEAVDTDPENGPAWFLLGDLSYLENSDFAKAEYYWSKALPFAPPEIRREITSRMARGRTDRMLERNYTAVETPNFIIRHSSGDNAQAERIGKYLEERFAALALEFGAAPSRLTVILYSGGSFDRLSGGHQDVLGLYDGRIRMPESQIGGQHEKVILSHELAHAFLHHEFGAKLPVWIQEGFAQAQEPVRLYGGEEAQILEKLRAGDLWTPIPYLDRRFSNPASSEQLTAAYLQSMLAVRYLLRLGGSKAFFAFLKEVSQGKALEAAFEETFEELDWNRFANGRGLGLDGL